MASAAAQTAEEFYRERQEALRERAEAQRRAGARKREPLRTRYAETGAASRPAPGFVPAPREARLSIEDAVALHPLPKLWTLSVSEIRALCLIIIVVAGVGFAIVQLSAMAAVTQSQINDLNKNITQTNDDIANLKVDIEQAQDMQAVRTLAETELGMKEPSYDQYVYLSDVPDPGQNFANTIKEKAYGEQPPAQGTDANGAPAAP
ncbi:MAG: hypothetical protein FWF33_06540 [Clostridiales bacterium]|nr:hypothetical protein [Clostridiales bacterium]